MLRVAGLLPQEAILGGFHLIAPSARTPPPGTSSRLPESEGYHFGSLRVFIVVIGALASIQVGLQGGSARRHYDLSGSIGSL